jgi:superfamily II DNA or RNA helicase
MRITLDMRSVDSYRTFLRIKSLPKYRIVGEFAEFPDEYAASVIGQTIAPKIERAYQPTRDLFDYQRDISALAIRKRKFAAFADCGLGKTRMMLEYARHVLGEIGAHKSILIVSPLMVIDQTREEHARFYPTDAPLRKIRARELGQWLATSTGEIGITNYEALDESIDAGNLGALILDESSMLKSHYGAWGQECIRLGRGLDWKLCLTGTPAPNDRVEYANHAVFLDQFPTVNAFLARFFVNTGNTGERWEMKSHAARPFYRELSHWSIFLSNPAVYGWRDNCQTLPPIRHHIHEIPMTREQRDAVADMQGTMFVDQIGGIGQRAKLSRLAKGDHDGREIPTNKPGFIRDLVNSWVDQESTLIWCVYNREQESMQDTFPTAASISGDTDEDKRYDIVRQFKAGENKILISKPKILGFGLNLQIATRQVFSGLQDSYESYYQAVKRSNRIGSKKPLDVHIPITEIEAPMVDNVLRKAKRVDEDTREQEALFRENRTNF